ncbi:hypothetical protein C4D60_Mb03t01020 [Musa balbisiana]|uniref:Uncharacterized protein n=1 Tax=Musa balbisiana TaxID=52838 RepID=A0A4S8J6N5_MUSBA|nr:hypothetical protein C4D60_Mb03t01020 [Musa balbisiana]
MVVRAGVEYLLRAASVARNPIEERPIDPGDVVDEGCGLEAEDGRRQRPIPGVAVAEGVVEGEESAAELPFRSHR